MYPRHRRHRVIEVVIVGGGITGCATAYAFAAAGVSVALVEAGAIGQAGTGGEPRSADAGARDGLPATGGALR